ncbi:hypothetical protein B0H16DRAFT_1468287 [Mycena metata]|uniref:Uncharacterized protein n=1 Tax=Mycena metata TaxID=1033252 RepID=A0AAD7I1J0_9AGAR|nr:hypothetical protein B0H16DRAFT_1468287 [Mycena metata]
MSAPTPSQEVFTGPIDHNTKKADLQALARALSLPIKVDGRTLVKEDLRANIETRLFGSGQDNTLEQDPCFAQLYESRKTREKKAVKGKKRKTSAQKTAEDVADQAKPTPKLTPANLKLLEGKVTTDPPAGFAPLGLHSDPQVKKIKRKISGSSLTTTATEKSDEDITPPKPDNAAGSANTNGDQESGEDGDEDVEDNKPKTSTAVIDAPILVKFSHPTDKSQPTTEIFVHGLRINNVVTPGGRPQYEADLRAVVPAALNHLSPIKNDRAARIARPGLTADAGTMPIGHVGELLDAQNVPDKLQYQRVYKMALKEQGEDLVCDLFYEPQSMSASSAGPAIHQAGSSSSTPVTTSLTGVGSDRPFDIAKARAAARPPLQRASINSPEELFQLLRFMAGSEKLTIRTNVVGRDALMSFREFDPFFKKFAPYKKHKGGYLIPADYVATPEIAAAIPNWADFRNTMFTKELMIHAAGVGKTATNEVHILIGTASQLNNDLGSYLRTGHRSDVEATDKTRELEDRYGGMQYREFKAMLQEEIEENKAGPSRPRKTAAKSKRARTEEASDEEVERPKKSKKAVDKELRKLEKRVKELKKLKVKDDGISSDNLDGDTA